MSVEQRFEKYVSPEPNTGCWLWTGTADESGYGHFRLRGETVGAHRLSWKLHRGDPGSLYVLHKCDMRSCVNPDHLFLGTQRDNMHDMATKGRRARVILTADKVREMRKLWSGGATSPQLAQQFGVSRGAVNGVVFRRNWRHVL